MVATLRPHDLGVGPALESAADVSDMASLLHVFSDPDNNSDAQRFLDLAVRSNSWQVGALSTTENIHHISQTRKERALYLSQKNQMNLGDAARHRWRLLALCSHFSGDEGAADAETAVGNES